MAQYRNRTPDARIVTYGLPSPVTVQPDEVLTVPDQFAEAYGGSAGTDIWAPLEVIAAPSVPVEEDPE